MTAKFVVTAPTINTIIDGQGPEGTYMSVVPFCGYKGIELVIGCRYAHVDACSFSKDGLKELIDILTDIHEVMVG